MTETIYENQVFVSYAWEDESERTVDELERAFADRGIRIMRDKKELGYRGSIEAFERRIGQGQCIVLVISDKFLCSKHCMYELMLIDKNQNLRDRIFPIVLANAKIYDAIDQLSYIKHWEGQTEQLNQAMKQVGVMTNMDGINADLNKYARIRSSFDHLANLLSDMNALTPEMHAANGFSTLINAVKDVMQIDPGISDIFNSPRGQVLWRLAYSFLRLDQLPSGGWGKTLYHWMEVIWKGDNGTIARSSETRFNGGTDLTTYAFCNYCFFLEKSLQSPDKIRVLMEKNEVADRVYDNFTKRVGYQGAVGSQRSLRAGVASEVRLRHTLMGLIALLLYGRINQYEQIKDVLENIHQYLVNNLSEWKHDESHLFAMVAAAIKLKNMLSPDIPQGQLESKQVEALQAALARYIPDMLAAANRPLNYVPQPPDTISGPLGGAIFRPYGNFWRMERSNFLMHFPGLVTDDGQSFLPEVSDSLKQRCAQIFSELLDEIELPSAASAPHKQLIRYHRKPKKGADHGLETPRDWGLSAELAVLLQMEAVRELLSAYQDYDKKREALNEALLDTFDTYNEHPEIFEFTHGAAFGRVLQLFDMKIAKSEEVEKLDEALSNLCAEGVTERGLAHLIRDYIGPASPEAAIIEARALRDLLITKLESGEYTPDIRMGKYAPSKRVCYEKDWAQVVQTVANDSTVAFYDSDLSDKHIERYVSAPRLNLIYEIQYLFKQLDGNKGTALDVGCGAGQYSKLLAKLGFEVTLLDASRKMLKLASVRLKIPLVEPINIFDASWRYPEASFDLIFASAIMIHVPQEKRDHIYANFRRLLKPDGILFVNYKIGDHTLISQDGRFFAYYRDDSQSQRELEDNGFQIRIEILDSNYKDMYQKPKLIRWAHFFCTKK